MMARSTVSPVSPGSTRLIAWSNIITGGLRKDCEGRIFC